MKNRARLSIPDVAHLFADYLSKNPAWGSLHIILDDGNVDDHSVRFCVKSAKEEGDKDGEYLALILLTMSRTQRLKISDAAYAINRNKPEVIPGCPLWRIDTVPLDVSVDESAANTIRAWSQS